MIQRLRWRFILLSMAAFFTVIAAVNIAANVANYNNAVREADQLIDILSSNHGHFPEQEHDPRKPGRGISPETPYETRFFSVVLSVDGSVLQTDTGFIAAVNEERAVEMAHQVLEKSASEGFMGDYRYRTVTEESGTRVIFLDCMRSLDSVRQFLVNSILISVLALIAVFLIIWLSSPRIIRPTVIAYEKQKQFITDAGHELKTPLTIIRADADVLEMEIGENEWLLDIQKQTKQLSALTSDLVCLARLEENKPDMPMLEFPVSDVVEETAASFLAPARAQGRELIISVEPMLACRGIEKNVRQLVRILLDNALKYSPDGSVITLRLVRQGKLTKLSCVNRCANALTQQDTQRLFERFYRTDPSRNSGTGGFGLGLSIANAIMTAHGGKLQASLQSDELTITAVFPA